MSSLLDPLTFSQLEQEWSDAYAAETGSPSPPDVAATAAAIAEAESAAVPGRIQQGVPYISTGWGLWQITPGNSVPKYGVDAALLDPYSNAEAAVAKYLDSEKRGAPGFEPWTTWKWGAYRAYEGGAGANTQPYTGPNDPPAGSGGTAPAGYTLTSAGSSSPGQGGSPPDGPSRSTLCALHQLLNPKSPSAWTQIVTLGTADVLTVVRGLVFRGVIALSGLLLLGAGLAIVAGHLLSEHQDTIGKAAELAGAAGLVAA